MPERFDAHHYLFEIIFIRLASKLYRQIVGNITGTNCVSFVADLVSFCYERDFMLFFSDKNQVDVV